MPQFGVYRNPGRDKGVPFVVQVQSTRLDRTRGRVVLPLVERGADTPPDHPLTPHLTILGREVYANPLDIVAVPAARLGNVLELLPGRMQEVPDGAAVRLA